MELRPGLHVVGGVREVWHPDAGKHVDKLVKLLPAMADVGAPMFAVHFVPKGKNVVAGYLSPQHQVELAESLSKQLERCCAGILPVYPRANPNFGSLIMPICAMVNREVTLESWDQQGRPFRLLISRVDDPRARIKILKDLKRASRLAKKAAW